MLQLWNNKVFFSVLVALKDLYLGLTLDAEIVYMLKIMLRLNGGHVQINYII